jgi:hypothetical protein
MDSSVVAAPQSHKGRCFRICIGEYLRRLFYSCFVKSVVPDSVPEQKLKPADAVNLARMQPSRVVADDDPPGDFTSGLPRAEYS